jgi:hypothetical protein
MDNLDEWEEEQMLDAPSAPPGTHADPDRAS